MSHQCWKYFLVLSGFFLLTETATLQCYKESINDYEVAAMDNPGILVNSSCIDKVKRTVVYVFGYKGMVNGTATTTMLTAYIKKGIYNVILLNWQQEASTVPLYGVEASYLLSAIPNAISIGKQLGQALVKLSNLDVNLTTIECVGHSLGAHLCGYAGREVNSNGKAVGTMIGLDPSGPFYDQYFPRQIPLDSTCAQFVYSIHSDPGNYGMNSSTAKVDIWPNFGNFIDGTNLQPGCHNGSFEKFSAEDLCSHNLSWKLHNESLYISKALQASEATSYSSWVANGVSSNVIDLDAVDRMAEGNFYLTTNGASPFGRGEAGLTP